LTSNNIHAPVHTKVSSFQAFSKQQFKNRTLQLLQQRELQELAQQRQQRVAFTHEK
jgi:hypothetical protein